ncbi:MAG: hypothetical protein KJT03_03650 [Verrucomicrobiae bacterium]|nr:hypothetical protein [Verrucomicrobiae bacterium]
MPIAIIKQFTLLLLILAVAGFGCSEKSTEAEITIETQGEPRRTIRISIEGEKDVVIDDPYIEEIESLSQEYKQRRAQFAKSHRDLTREQVDAYSAYADAAAERMRELQKLRKSYILEKMKEHNASSFTTEGEVFSGTLEETSDYFEGLKPNH